LTKALVCRALAEGTSLIQTKPKTSGMSERVVHFFKAISPPLCLLAAIGAIDSEPSLTVGMISHSRKAVEIYP
jgi:hypothetical protein